MRSSMTWDQTSANRSSKTARAYRLGISEVRDQPKKVRICCNASSMETFFESS